MIDIWDYELRCASTCKFDLIKKKKEKEFQISCNVERGAMTTAESDDDYFDYSNEVGVA